MRDKTQTNSAAPGDRLIRAGAIVFFVGAVATGPCPEEELRAAGADVVLTDLTEFPRWLSDYRPARA